MNDPAGIFPSNEHRRVLGHLSHPEDEYGWSPEQLVVRMGPDPDTRFEKAEDIEKYLVHLAKWGDAEQSEFGWRMTRQGFDALNGPIADEPPPTAPVVEPEPQKRRRWRR